MWINTFKTLLWLSLLISGYASASETLDTASTVWMMLSTLLVLLMFIPFTLHYFMVA